MPITPRFHLSQTTTHLIITIHIPHIRVSASTLEIIVDKDEFHFYSSPYLLHLNFNNSNNNNNNDNRNLVDDESICKEAKAIYDPSKENGTLVVNIWKEEEGTWDDLDLLGRLMMNKDYYTSAGGIITENSSKTHNNSTSEKAKIQVLHSSQNENVEDDEHENNENNSYSNNQKENPTFEEIQSCLRPHYGFLKMHHSIFIAYAREGLSHEMLEIPNPDDTLMLSNGGDVREMRLQMENEKFCPNRYLGDLYISDKYDDEDVDMTYLEAKNMVPHWQDTKKKASSVTSTSTTTRSTSNSVNTIVDQLQSMTVSEEQDSTSFFTKEESLHLASIKADIPPLSQITKEQTQSSFLSLLDILYSYVYDHRITNGESTCESSWTIVMLSPTLSWLESYNPPYDTIDQVVRWSIRRALIYPYCRNFDMLSNLLVHDVISIIHGGRRVILRCLLQIHKILDHSEVHYLFNKLFINQYICWIQLIDESLLNHFSNEVKECCLSLDGNDVSNVLRKENMELDLDLIEQNAFDDNDDDDSSQDEEESDDSSDDNDSDDSSENDDDDDDDDDDNKKGKLSPMYENNKEHHFTSSNTSSSLLDDQIGCPTTENKLLQTFELVEPKHETKKIPLITEI